MAFSSETKARALAASGRHCCICHKFCGTKIECHHIRQEAEGGDDGFENCLPVCFDCHADMRSYDFKHPRGTKYGEAELRAHREAWYTKVASSGGLSATTEHRDVDRVTFQALRESIPWTNIDFVRTNNFAGFSFPRDAVDPLFDYAEIAADPSKEFLDAELEGLRVEFVTAIRVFGDAIGTHTFAHHIPGRAIVPPEWEMRSPEVFDRAVQEIHSGAQQVVQSYDALIRAGRARLCVS